MFFCFCHLVSNAAQLLHVLEPLYISVLPLLRHIAQRTEPDVRGAVRADEAPRLEISLDINDARLQEILVRRVAIRLSAETNPENGKRSGSERWQW